MKGKRPAKSVSLASALLKKSGPPPALPPRPGAEPSGGGGGIGVGSLGLGPTSISGGFGSNGSSGTGGFGSNGSSGGPRAAFPPVSPRVGPGAAVGAKGKGKSAPDLAHCFELHSGKLLGDKRNREGRLYFKVGRWFFFFVMFGGRSLGIVVVVGCCWR